jgi:hypothetical protein
MPKPPLGRIEDALAFEILFDLDPRRGFKN